MRRRVTVTGMGIISAIGQNIREFNKSLRTGHCGIHRLESYSKSRLSINIGAEIQNFSFESALQYHSSFSERLVQKAIKLARRSPFVIQTSVISALEAWLVAGLNHHDTLSERIGIIVAGQNITQNYQYGLYSKFIQNPEYLSPRYALHFLDTDQVGTLSEIFEIKGEGFVVGGASASGNVGIIKGLQLIEADLLDTCLVVGVLADLSPMDIQGFYNIGAMGGKRFANEPKNACRPFDKDHEGFIYGQASGCLILESLETASKRGAQNQAELLGGALTLDSNRLSEPSVEGQMSAMNSALSQSGILAKEVDYLNAHGSSSALGDKIEIEAIREIFKESLSRLWINSTKGLTGHCIYSAGIVEIIATIIQMQEGFLHPNVNLKHPIDKECRFCGSKAEKANINIAMSNSFGFGGINTSIVLKKGD